MRLELATEKKHHLSSTLSGSWIGCLQVVLGSIFLGLMAQLAIPLPFNPIPLSVQTLAISLLAISLGSRKAPLAVMAYLVQATFGLPVLAGGLSNPLWMIGPKAGYLIGFVLVAYLVAASIENQKKKNFFKSWMTFALGEIILLSCGSLWLSYFIGLEKAFLLGFLPFLPGALVKISIATCSLMSFQWAKSRPF